MRSFTLQAQTMQMKFSAFVYKRPDLEGMQEEANRFFSQIEQATSAESQLEAIRAFYRLRSHFETMSNVAQIRYSANTTDKFYEQEQAWFDQQGPYYQELVHRFYRLLVRSPFRQELEQKLGPQLFQLAEMTLQTFTPEIIPDLQRENELSTRYTNLIASAEISFNGGSYNLSGMVPFKMDPDRAVRKAAHEAADGWLEKQEAELDAIFAELVAVRHLQARKLGYENFIPLGYLRMCRSGYNAADVARFRDNILGKIVPKTSELREMQRRRLGLTKLLYFDELLDFPEGNPKPVGTETQIIERAQQMYDELSEETGAFFRMMQERELMDLITRPHKAAGGYCTYLSELKAPYIFANFNGTSGDIDVLTHEAGHAFQTWCSRDLEVLEYSFPTSEAAEIHSMGMELLTWPWMHLFFGVRARQYQFSHLSHNFMFLPYSAAIDEFQHWIYAHPDAEAKQWKACWRALEKRYLPHRNYGGSAYLQRGTYWHRQAHVFKYPFYYIDYALAQVCAFQLWELARQDLPTAMKQYLVLCRLGGSRPFLELVAAGSLQNPFVADVISRQATSVSEWLDGYMELATF
ncbi:MAG: M3 family oligoendopeptidase [Chitinophagales bacterium]|nr:M3 family oligoendopeptidase [Chitinophagales bacterium]MDW8427612.1 M3 family oligoendopeptidase [Chitinophagales bacterium]